MSIIHDALKKTQDKLKDLTNPSQSLKNSPHDQGKTLNPTPPGTPAAPVEKYSSAPNVTPASPVLQTAANKSRLGIKMSRLNLGVLFIFSLAITLLILKFVPSLTPDSPLPPVPKPNIIYNQPVIRTAQTLETKKIIPQTKVQEKTEGNEITINGIVTMGDKNVALINNEIYEEGETVSGYKIIDIAVGQIKLSDGKKVQTLKVK